MIHYMKLRNKPFMMIRSGKKKIEMRLYDEKRMLINVGDMIEFKNIDSEEIIKVLVVNLYRFNSFKELYDNFDKSLLGYENDDEASYIDMEEYYSRLEQEKYGVLGIEIKLC